MDHDFSYIHNSIIDTTCLNRSKLNLNNKGSALPAVQFIKFLISISNDTQRPKIRDLYFQMALFKQLGQILMTIGNQRLT